MRVRVDQRRQEGQSGAVDRAHITPLIRDAADGADDAVVDDDVHVGTSALTVEHTHIRDEKGRRRGLGR